jgi:hypothetical protein
LRKQVSIKPRISAVVAVITLIFLNQALADRDRDRQQAEMDTACEQARQVKLAPMRAQFVEECVQNRELRDRTACEAFYADYGAQSGNRAPLFFDLPECVKAFDFQHNERQSR